MDLITSTARPDWDAAAHLGQSLARVGGYAVLAVIGLFTTAVLVWIVWDVLAAGLSWAGRTLAIPAFVAAGGDTRAAEAEEADEIRRTQCLTLLDRDPALIGIRDVRRIVRLANRAEPSTYERCYWTLAERRFPDDSGGDSTPGRRPRGIAGVREAWVRWRIERWLIARSW